MQTIMNSLLIIGPAILLFIIIVYVLSLRRIVPTNVVHIVQRGKNTVSYGVGKENNVYYEFPGWLPKLGVTTRVLPVSNFEIALKSYSAYDQARVPFVVDIMAFFHIADTNIAAAKVEDFSELKTQLTSIVQGAVRSILAKSKLEEIMEERPKFSKMFTDAVSEDLKAWGVSHVKGIELMDVRDDQNSTVIHNIMAKRISAIGMESRVEVAKNDKLAEQAELTARQEIAVTAAESERISGEAEYKSKELIGMAKADSEKKIGIADQNSKSDVAQAERKTAEQQMEVIKVNEVKQAEIDKDKAIILAEQKRKEIEIDSEANKFKVEMDAIAALEAKKRDAEGVATLGTADAGVIQAKGMAEAESRKQMELASVTAQTTLAKEIGQNNEYQAYLIKLKEVEVSQVIGVAQANATATALSKADLKLLVNSGDVSTGINKFSDILTSKGGSNLTGLLEGLKQTPEGLDLVTKLLNLLPTTPKK